MQEKLRSLYKKNPNNKLPSFLEEEQSYQSIESSYINLAIVDLKAQQEREAKLLASSGATEQNIDSELDSPEDNIDESNTIDVEKLFLNSGNKKKDKGKEKVGISSNDNDEIKEVEKVEKQEEQLSKIHQKVLIHGKAGIGKTTLMKYITYQWACGELWNEFEYVFSLPLRKLNNFQKTNHHDGIESFIYECCLSNGESNFNIKKDIKEIKSILGSNKVLLLLDGYDEFAPKEENKDFVKSILNAVLNHSKLSIIMTSRPNMVESTYKELFDCQLVNIGFSDTNVNDYIEKNFTGKEEEKESLYKLIRENRTVQGMCHTPLNLHLLCLVWVDLLNEKQGKINSQEFSTTNLYVGIVDWLIRRYVKKTKYKKIESEKVQNLTHECIERSYNLQLKLHEKIAYRGLKQGKAVLPKGLIAGVINELQGEGNKKNDELNYKNTQRLGLLKAIDGNQQNDNITTESDINKEHYFIHLTFQEYMTARCLVRMLNSGNEQQVREAIEFLDNNKYVQRYERMICFVAGIVSLDKNQSPQPSQALLHFWNVMINGRPDLGIVKQLNLIIKCMDESGIDTRIPDIEKIKDYIKNTIQSITKTRGRKAVSKIPERIEEWLGIAKISEEIDKEQEIKDLLANLQSEDSKEKLEAIEMIKEIEVKSLSQAKQKEIVEVLIKLHKKSQGQIYEKMKEILSELAREVKEEGLQRQINYALTREEIRENELIKEVEEKISLEKSVWDIKKYIEEIVNLTKKVRNKSQIVAALVLLLESKNEYIRSRAAEVLGKMSITDLQLQGQLISVLVPLLQDEDNLVRIRAAEVLSKMNITDLQLQGQLVSALVSLLQDEDNLVRIRAAEVLSKMNITDLQLQGQLVSALVSLLQDKDNLVRIRAAETLGKTNITDLQLQAQIVKALVPLLDDKLTFEDQDNLVCSRAAEALSKMNITNLQLQTLIVKALVPLLEYLNSDTCSRAAEVLGKINITNLQLQTLIVKALVPLLEYLNSDTCSRAAEVLGKINITDLRLQTQIFKALVPLLEDDNWHVCSRAAEALSKMNITNLQLQALIVKALVPLLKSRNSLVRIRVAEVLGKINITDLPLQVQIVKALVSLLESEDKSDRISTLEALGKMNITDIQLQVQMVEALVPLLQDKKWDVRLRAAEALGKMNITDVQLQAQMVEALVYLLQDKDWDVCLSVAEALGKMNTIDIQMQAQIVAALMPLLKIKNEYVVIRVVKVLSKMDITHLKLQARMSATLVPLLESKYIFVRITASEALDKMNIIDLQLQGQIVNALAFLLKNRNQDIYYKVTSILINLNMIDSIIQTTLISKLLSLLEGNNVNIAVLTNITKILVNLEIDLTVNLQPLAEKLSPILIKLVQEQGDKSDNNLEILKFRIAHLLSKVQFKDLEALRDIVLSLARQQDRSQVTTLLNLYTEQLLVGNISITLSKETVRLISLPLFRQAAVAVDEDKVVINYRGYQREMPFVKGEDKAEMAYKVFSYFYQQHQLSGVATELLSQRLNFSRVIQVSGLDIELGNITLAKSVLQQHIYSCINSSIRLTCQQWMISVVRRDTNMCNNARHVFMIIEGRNIFHEAELYRLELLQPNADQFSERGRIEITEEAHIDVGKQGELARVFQIILGNTHYNGNNGFRVDQDYYHKSCTASREVAMQLINQAREERARATEVVYDFYGIKAPNCFSWARKKLRENLEAKQYERLEIEKAGERYADPLAYLGPTADNTWAWVSHNINDVSSAIGAGARKLFRG